MTQQEPIPRNHLMTAQEHVFFGSTPEIIPETQEDWYKPQGILVDPGSYTINNIKAAREKLGWVRPPVMENGLRRLGHLSEGKNYAIRLENLDPETGQTIKDPEGSIGVWDNETGELTVEGNVTDVIKQQVAESGEEMRYRIEGHTLDFEGGGSPERG